MRCVRACVFFLALFCASVAQAGFFIPKGTSMAMFMYTPSSRSFDLTHGFTRDWSATLGWHRYENDDGEDRRDFTLLRANYLLYRGYGSGGIANVYVFGGPAYAEAEDGDDGLGWHAGLWGDYETRRVYARLSVQTHQVEDVGQTITTGQALWAPYAADYEDIATWVGLQVERRNHLSDATEVTPMLRLFQRDWWVDAGVSVNKAHRGDVFLNLMFLF